ncbi:MAG: hypothetical protein HYY37_05780 [Candidatus Aenigmarchaeota archaeon]|nr:hypothetical protein [Candidatus Aenigmarchaeota archaeon]
MKVAYALLVLSIALMPLLYVAFGLKLLVIYALIWTDKLLIGLVKPLRLVGVDLSTFAAVLAGMAYGPLAAFVFVLIVYTFLWSLRYLLVPILLPDWPLFVPDRYGVVYASAGIIAGFMAASSFSMIMITAVAAKILIHGTAELLLGKPVRVIQFIGTIVFHALVIIPFGMALV